MRNPRRAFLLLCVAAAATLCAERDDAAVRRVVARYMQARNTRNPEALRDLFTPDADQLVSSGEWRKGLPELIRGMQASSQKEAPQSSIAVESVRLIQPDVAIADGRYETTASNGTARHMWTTIILKRAQGEWRIAAIRNMLPSH